MKLKKNILRILILSILFNNIYFHSNASTLTRYETLEGEFIDLGNVDSKDVSEIEIFGNTVQDPNNLQNIQSVGELYVDNKGQPILDNLGREQYQIEIESVGKNLFKNDMEQGSLDAINGLVTNTTDLKTARTKEFIRIKGNTKYCFTFEYDNIDKISGHIYFYDKGKSFISRSQITRYNQSDARQVAPPTNAEYCKIVMYYHYSSTDYGRFIQMEEGARTNYTPYKSNKTTILLPCQLMKVGNIADRLYWDSNKRRYIIEKNISKNVIDSISATSYYYSGDNSYAYYVHNINSSNDKNFSISYSHNYMINRFKDIIYSYYSSSSPLWTFDKFGNMNLLIRFPKEEKFSTVEKTLLFLKENDINIYFQNKVPELIETNITKKIELTTYPDKTYISIVSKNEIKPTSKITIDRIEETSKEAVENVLSNPTSNNIALARMFVNMLPDSLYKDQLQTKLNEIFSEDMVLEKQSATVNLDVYIQSENILMMSLDTNTVTFEDYSGVEELELQNAINISINSSLPYSLNAYIVGDITNKDKNKTLDLDVLNIRDGSEVEYKKFDSINNKLILQDNCNKGNDINHNIDLKLSGDKAHDADVYKTTIKFEVEQK